MARKPYVLGLLFFALLLLVPERGHVGLALSGFLHTWPLRASARTLPRRRCSVVSRRAASRSVDSADFAAAVARALAGYCDRPLTAQQLLDGGALRIREEARGTTDPEAPPSDQWQRFWGELRSDGQPDAWHEELYWRLVRGQNCQVFAGQVAHAWLQLCMEGEFTVLHAGEPVVGAYIFHSHVRVDDLLEQTPTVYLGSPDGEAFPTYSTIGRQYEIISRAPRLARQIGIDPTRQARILGRGMRLCEFLDEDPKHVCAHIWCALATETAWFHIDLCGVAYGCAGRSAEGWPLHTFETAAHDLSPCPAGQWGEGKLAVQVNERTQSRLVEDAEGYRHFGFLFRKAGYPADERIDAPEVEDVVSWFARAPQGWFSEDFIRSVRQNLAVAAKP